jgi:WD40 repeat protein
VRLRDPVTGRPAGNPLTGHTGRVNAVAFGTLPDGRMLLASAYSDGVRLWDPVSGAAAGHLLTHRKKLLIRRRKWVMIVGVAFGVLPDGRVLLASACSDGVRLWDPVSGAAAGHRLIGRKISVDGAAFGVLPDGRVLLASACSDGVRLWDPVTGAPAHNRLSGDLGPIAAVAFGMLPDGRVLLASAGYDYTVRLWDPVTGRPAGNPLTGHTGTVDAVAFGTLPDGRVLLASAGDDGVRLWDPASPALGALHCYRTAPSVPKALCFEGTTVYLGCSDGIIALDVASDVLAPDNGAFAGD